MPFTTKKIELILFLECFWLKKRLKIKIKLWAILDGPKKMYKRKIKHNCKIMREKSFYHKQVEQKIGKLKPIQLK